MSPLFFLFSLLALGQEINIDNNGAFSPQWNCGQRQDSITIRNNGQRASTLLFPGPAIPTVQSGSCEWKCEKYRTFVQCQVNPGGIVSVKLHDPNVPLENKFGVVNASPFQGAYAEINLGCH